MRLLVVRFAIAAALGYATCMVIGTLVSPGMQLHPIHQSAATAALEFSFPEAAPESSQWLSASGSADNRWLLRRAFVEGQIEPPPQTRFSEQVLKVGWPFTVVRGFVRSAGSEVWTTGARIVGPAAPGLPVRMIPLQPVWPGVVTLGLLGALFASALARWRRPRATAG